MCDVESGTDGAAVVDIDVHADIRRAGFCAADLVTQHDGAQRSAITEHDGAHRGAITQCGSVLR